MVSHTKNKFRQVAFVHFPCVVSHHSRRMYKIRHLNLDYIIHFYHYNGFRQNNPYTCSLVNKLAWMKTLINVDGFDWYKDNYNYLTYVSRWNGYVLDRRVV
jgi:hypothetical protein